MTHLGPEISDQIKGPGKLAAPAVAVEFYNFESIAILWMEEILLNSWAW